MTSFEAKEEECSLIHVRRTTSACYRLGYCYVLVDRVYKHKCEAVSLEIRPMLTNTFWTTVNFEIGYFLNEDIEDVSTDVSIVMNFHDWHLT